MDNCSAHKTQTFEKIEFLFLPPNTTSVTQPLDCGVINCCKKHYRQKLLEKYVHLIDTTDCNEQISLLDAIRLMKDAWDRVSQGTITNCFRMSGTFKEACIEGEGGATDEPLDIFIVEENVLPALDHIKERLTDYFRCDEQLATSEQLTDTDILDQVQASRVSNQENVNIESDDDQGEEMALVTKNQALQALRVIEIYSLQTAKIEDASESINNLEKILKSSGKVQTQSLLVIFQFQLKLHL